MNTRTKMISFDLPTANAYINEVRIRDRAVYEIVYNGNVVATCITFEAARRLWDTLCVN